MSDVPYYVPLCGNWHLTFRDADMVPAQAEPITMTEFEMRPPTTLCGWFSPLGLPIDTLDIGCGPHKAKGSLGIDRYSFDGRVDIVRDVMRGLPFNNAVFKHIIAKHILEHFDGNDLLFLIDEMYRVSIDGADWIIVVPDATSPNKYRDPTHKIRDWHEDSFMLWEVDDKGDWSIFVGPDYGRNAKLRRLACGLNENKDRLYQFKVVK